MGGSKRKVKMRGRGKPAKMDVIESCAHEYVERQN